MSILRTLVRLWLWACMPSIGGDDSGGNSETSELIQDRRMAVAEGGIGVSADGGPVTINQTVSDLGAIDRAFDLGETSVIASTLAATQLGSRAIDAGQTLAIAGFDFADAQSARVAEVAGQSIESGERLSRWAGDSVRSGYRDAFDAAGRYEQRVSNAFGSALESVIENASASQNTIAASAQRATSQVADAFTRSQDSATGNRTLIIGGVILAGLAAIFFIGPRIKA